MIADFASKASLLCAYAVVVIVVYWAVEKALTRS